MNSHLHVVCIGYGFYTSVFQVNRLAAGQAKVQPSHSSLGFLVHFTPILFRMFPADNAAKNIFWKAIA
jgi:hypothetical protein